MIDRYTKSVLTVIAAMLTLLAVQSITDRSNAQTSSVQKVQICDKRTCATLRPVALTFAGQSIEVDVLPVSIELMRKNSN